MRCTVSFSGKVGAAPNNMLHHHNVLLILALVILASSSIVVFLIAKAPEGHENESGFYRQAMEKPAAKRETKAEIAASAVASDSAKTA